MKFLIKNPHPLLQIVTNPADGKSNKSTPTPKKGKSMSKVTEGLSDLKELVIPASMVVLGQAGATKLTKFALEKFLQSNTELVRKLAATGIPLATAVAILMFGGKNNKYAVPAAVGAAISGLLSLVRTSVPGFDLVPLADYRRRAPAPVKRMTQMADVPSKFLGAPKAPGVHMVGGTSVNNGVVMV